MIRTIFPIATAALLGLAGCQHGATKACFDKTAPLIDQVVKAIDQNGACKTDGDCHLVDPSLPCASLCRAATSDPAAVAAAVAKVAPQCPGCTVESTCARLIAFCNQTVGACDTCTATGRVGDGKTPGDDCWAPPAHRCSGVDPSAPTVWACPPAGTNGDCCRYDRGCLPCGWANCSTDPKAPGCATVGTPTDGGTPMCPTVPHGTVCFDAERYP